MRALLSIVIFAFVLAGCQHRPDARVTREAAAAPTDNAVTKARAEPVFYNGKTYQFALSPASGGLFTLAVNGMSRQQEKDAVAVATSSLRYFACKDTQDSKLVNKPEYSAGQWRMQARCV